MRLQYFSDLHLEFGHMPFPHRDDVDCIIAAGDIAPGVEGLAWLAQARCPVVYVAGNHEFYGQSMEPLRSVLAGQTLYPHVHFLDNSVLVLGDVRFLGTTLWTDFDGAGPNELARFADLINDYVQIESSEKRTLTPVDTLQLNVAATIWLEQALCEPWDGTTVVVTHHAPSIRSWPRGRDLNFRPAYCNSLESMIARHRVELWVHGHIHAVCDYQLPASRTRIVCNPRGYTGFQTIPDFEADRTVNLKDLARTATRIRW
jgi:predicted phosphohydrolase